MLYIIYLLSHYCTHNLFILDLALFLLKHLENIHWTVSRLFKHFKLNPLACITLDFAKKLVV